MTDMLKGEPFTNEDVNMALKIIETSLKPKYREIINLRYKEQLQFKEIGEIMGFTDERARQLVNEGLRRTFLKIMRPMNDSIETDVKERRKLHPTSTLITDLNLSVRAYNCLDRRGLKTVGDIMLLTKEELFNIRNLGQKSVEDILTKLTDIGVDVSKFN